MQLTEGGNISYLGDDIFLFGANESVESIHNVAQLEVK